MESKKKTPAGTEFVAYKVDRARSNCPGHLAPLRHLNAEMQYKNIRGVKYDTHLLNLTIAATQGGHSMSLLAAKGLIGAAIGTTGSISHGAIEGDKNVVETRLKTIDYIIAFYRFDSDAHQLLDEELNLKAGSMRWTRAFQQTSTDSIFGMLVAKNQWTRKRKAVALSCWNNIYQLPCEPKCRKTHWSNGFARRTSQFNISRAAARDVSDQLINVEDATSTLSTLTAHVGAALEQVRGIGQLNIGLAVTGSADYDYYAELDHMSTTSGSRITQSPGGSRFTSPGKMLQTRGAVSIISDRAGESEEEEEAGAGRFTSTRTSFTSSGGGMTRSQLSGGGGMMITSSGDGDANQNSFTSTQTSFTSTSTV